MHGRRSNVNNVIGSKVSAVDAGYDRARPQKQKKKSTPPFLYLFPLMPILFMFLMMGKSTDKDEENSFLIPQEGIQHPKQVSVISNDPVQVKKTSSKFTINQQVETLVQSPNTVVTAYFTLKSKYAKEEYQKWMSNMLGLNDAMVIFTTPDLLEMMQGFRAHASNRTVVITMDLKDVEIVEKFASQKTFWQDELKLDPEKRIHRSFELFWIWLSKSFFVTTASDFNFFQSDVYAWSDIGCFRSERYKGQEMILQRDKIPTDRILQMAHHKPNPPPYIWWNDKYTQQPLFYHSGSQMVGYTEIWKVFHSEFMKTVDGFVERNMFIGEDQTVLQSTCLRNPNICAYVPSDQVNDNHYFGLRYVLNTPDKKYEYWYPPLSGMVAEKSEVKDKSLLQPMKKPPPPSRKQVHAA
mmetsp:Transcript_30332/g.34580  ORF Transcript_30332/g.34580 Transcript_30332/m.34580 type:complete len:409 (+) Transcript_30332:73-1299(+)